MGYSGALFSLKFPFLSLPLWGRGTIRVLLDETRYYESILEKTVVCLLLQTAAEHFVLEIPKLFGKVDVIKVGIFKALHFFPKFIDLTLAVVADLFRCGNIIYTFAVLKDGDEHFAEMVIRNGLALPNVLRMEDLHRLAVIHHFIVEREKVGDRFAAFVIINAIELFEMGVRDLFCVFALIFRY